MIFNIPLRRKDTEVDVVPCTVEKLVTLSAEEFAHFSQNLMNHYDFIRENIDRMYQDENSVNHCLLVLGEGCTDGILVESEGSTYARYSAFVPNARRLLRQYDPALQSFCDRMQAAILHGRTERFNCGQQAGGSFLEGGTTASFTFDTTTLRIAALMHTRSISNVFRSYLQRWNRLSNRKPMSTCYFIRFLTRCCLLLQECLAVKCRMMMRPHSGHLNRYIALLYLTFVKSF